VAPPTPRKPWWRRWFGTRAERAAARGLHVLRRNYSCPHGELDLVALDGDTVVFVEVRSTESGDAERPAASVGRDKQERLTRLALHFLQAHRLLERPARFDVVLVAWPADKREPEVTHVPHAFEATGRFQMYH
jgi:putative endonuclease